MPEPQKPLCSRCNSELPEGSNFCAGCGHTNEGEMVRRSMNANKKIDDKIERGRFWRNLLGIFRAR